MVKKVLIGFGVAVLIVGSFMAYEYKSFTRQQALNQWCITQIVKHGPSRTFSFVNFTPFGQKLAPYAAIIINHEPGAKIKAFQYLQLPPKYDFSDPLKKITYNYSNILVFQPPAEVLNKLKQAEVVRVIFFTDTDQPILCDVPPEMLNDWKEQL